MRLAILSDTHANLPALEAVLTDLQPLHPDAILVAGDLANMGPYPRETLAALRNAGCTMIRGNGDDYLLAYHRGEWSPEMQASRQWAMTRWSYEQVKDAGLELIAALPDRYILEPEHKPALLMVHGSLRRSNEGLVPEENAAVVEGMRQTGMIAENLPLPHLSDTLDQIEQSVLICGHTHFQWQQAYGAKLALNPGSVGIPCNGDPRAQYALLSFQKGAWQVEQRLVAYDLERVRRGYIESGLLEVGGTFARLCLLDTLTCRNSAWFFNLHVKQIARQHGLPHASVYPDSIWDEANATFDWLSFQP